MNKKSVLYALGIAVAAALCLLICVRCSEGNSLVLGVDHSAQSELVPSFFAQLKAGDHEAAMEYVNNYESLGFERQSTELVELYKQKLVGSYSVKVLSLAPETENSLTSSQEIELTFLDSRTLLSAINEKTAVTVNDYLFGGYVIENDEQALEFVYDALYECLETPELYYTTERMTVQTIFDGEKWQIYMDDTLLDAMYGYVGSVSAEEIS